MKSQMVDRPAGKYDPRARAVREVGKQIDRTDRSDQPDQSDAKSYEKWLNHPDPEVVANAIIRLIHPRMIWQKHFLDNEYNIAYWIAYNSGDPLPLNE